MKFKGYIELTVLGVNGTKMMQECNTFVEYALPYKGICWF